MKDDILWYVLQGLFVIAVFAVVILSHYIIATSDLPEWLKFLLLN